MKIAYDRTGTGAPLVLIHGYPLDHGIWDEIVPILQKNFDLIIPDLRGFGASEMIEADNSIFDYASDIAKLMTQLKIKSAILAGHSMGGYVALAFAREFPQRVSGLALISSQVLADTQERKEGRYATAKQVMEDGVGVGADSMSPKLSSDPQIQKFVHDLISRQSRIGISDALHAIADRPDSSEVLTGIKVPVVLIHGVDDALIPVDRAREMKAARESSIFDEIPGVGHMPMMEKPQEVSKALLSFNTAENKRVKLLDK